MKIMEVSAEIHSYADKGDTISVRLWEEDGRWNADLEYSGVYDNALSCSQEVHVCGLWDSCNPIARQRVLQVIGAASEMAADENAQPDPYWREEGSYVLSGKRFCLWIKMANEEERVIALSFPINNRLRFAA